MKVFVSDLHLSDGGAADSFKSNQKPFLDFIDYLSANAEVKKLVIIGDLFFLTKTDLLSSLKAYDDFFEKLSKAPFEIAYITGNHDYHLGTFNKQSVLTTKHSLFKNIHSFYLDDQVFAEHGSRHDSFVYSHGRASLTEPIFYLTGYLENNFDSKITYRLIVERRKAFKQITDWLTKGYAWKNKALVKLGIILAAKAFKNETEKQQNTEVEKARLLEGYLKEHQISSSIIITAHSHRPFLSEFSDGKVLINSGSWVSDITSSGKIICPKTFVEVSTNEVSLKSWQGKSNILGKAKKVNGKWQVTVSYNSTYIKGGSKE